MTRTTTPGRRRVLHLITRLIVGGAQENTVASVARVAPDRYESHLWIGPQLGTEGSLVDDARSLGIDPVIVPDLVREIDPVRDIRATIELAKRMRRERFDLVHTHSSKAGIVGRLAARWAGVPSIVHTVHGWGFHDRMPRWRRLAFMTAERALVRTTDRLVSVAEETTRVGLAARIGTKTDYELIRSGIPRERFLPSADARGRVREELGLARDAVVVGSVGRLSAQKNPLDFVRIAERIVSAHPETRFLWVGDGPLRSEVESRIERAGMSDRFVLAGLRRDVPDLLAAMDVFVLTSLWEGLPRTIPQALSCGVPVVAYEVSGIREIVRDGVNGWAVPMGAVEVAAARVDELLSDPDHRAELSRRARDEFDPAFTEDEMIRRLEALYDRLLGSSESTAG